jgi:hypothetical protein
MFGNELPRIKPTRNSQFAITFCNGDLTPTQNLPIIEPGDLNPQSWLTITKKQFNNLETFLMEFSVSFYIYGFYLGFMQQPKICYTTLRSSL